MDNRKEFEQWFEDNYDKRGRTVNLQMKMDMWIGWQAARNDAWLLRKQAEAVDGIWHGYCREIPELDEKALLREDMMDAVRSLRQQADEAENG